MRTATWLRPLVDAVHLVVGAALATQLVGTPARACPPSLNPWAIEARPFYIAAAPSGRVYATNPISHTVSIHRADGSLLTTFGGLGSAHGQLDTPSGIAVDATGRVFVADTQNSRIEVFDADGNYLSTIQGTGLGAGQFLLPVDIATGPANDLFVVNQFPGANKVVRVGLNGVFLNEWPVVIDNTEYDIAADADGKVFGIGVSTSTSVDVFSSAGASLGSWPIGRAGETVVSGHLDAHGGVVALTMNVGGSNVIRTFDATGVIQCFGLPTTAVAGLATDASGHTFVGDHVGGQILRTTDIMVPVRASTWGSLKQRYR